MIRESVVQTFLGVFEELAQRYDIQTSITRDKANTGSDVVVIVAPANSGAAVIDARLEADFGVYALFGTCANLEIPFEGGYYTKLPWVDELRVLCLAVAAGKLREEVTFAGDKPLKGRFTFDLGSDRTFSETWRNLYVYPFKPRSVRTFTWEPYQVR